MDFRFYRYPRDNALSLPAGIFQPIARRGCHPELTGRHIEANSFTHSFGITYWQEVSIVYSESTIAPMKTLYRYGRELAAPAGQRQCVIGRV
jgi:hypothetical protein